MPAHEQIDNSTLAAAALACVAGTVAFAVYTRTLLPGVDLGDTGGFQAAVLWPEANARRGYPLYYFLATPFVAALTPELPARGLNLFSAVTGGLAVALLTFLASSITRSLLAGAVAGAMLAFSYTFWTQSVTAEVYGLHLALIAASMIALRGFERIPTLRRLAVFLAVYAVGFGNHLGMSLLLVPFALFLRSIHSRGELLRPRVVAMAVVIALAGALQYLPALMWTWTQMDAPADWRARVAMLWIDTTKANWRESMVLGISGPELRDRLAMWWWDSRQQFGIVGMMAAGIGALRLWWISRPWALLLWSGYAISTAFALTYNVGNPHVFFLPGHFIAALAMGAAASPIAARTLWPRVASLRGSSPVAIAAAAVLLVNAGWRAWDTYPAADRHLDRRADALVARAAAGLNDRESVLLSGMNWETESALLYSARWERRDLAWTRLPEVLPHLPDFVRDNQAIGREVVLTAEAARDVVAAYGAALPIVRDERIRAASLRETVAQIPEGLPYVLAFLLPPPGEELDEEDFGIVLEVLTRGASRSAPQRYELWAGLTGSEPIFHRASNRPFDARFSILGDAFQVRMVSWLPSDTFRRGGFGHVLRGRERELFVERGISLVWFRPDGSPDTVYAAGRYAPQPRFRIAPFAPQLARVD